VPLQGRSLAALILGPNYDGLTRIVNHKPLSVARTLQVQKENISADSNINYHIGSNIHHPVISDDSWRHFAISQQWRCAFHSRLHLDPRRDTMVDPKERIWFDCDINNSTTTAELSVMGYSMRTEDFRYTAWIHFDRMLLIPRWEDPLFAEELYDHRGEKLGEEYQREFFNQASSGSYQPILEQARETLLNFLFSSVVYRSRDIYRNVTASRTSGKGKGHRYHVPKKSVRHSKDGIIHGSKGDA
jgi:hypothetical protein